MLITGYSKPALVCRMERIRNVESSANVVFSLTTVVNLAECTVAMGWYIAIATPKEYTVTYKLCILSQYDKHECSKDDMETERLYHSLYYD